MLFTMKRAAVLSAFLSIACGGSATGVASTAAATYALATVNGQPLPFTSDSIPGFPTPVVTRIVSQQIATLVNHSVPNELFLNTVTVERIAGGAVPARTDTVRASQSASLDGSNFQTSTGVIAAHSMTLTSGTLVYVFTRIQ